MRAITPHGLSRGTAAAVAAGVQALALYVLIVSLRWVPAPPLRAVAPLIVELLENHPVHSQPPALQPHLREVRTDLGRAAPLIPVEIQLPPPPLQESAQTPLPVAGSAEVKSQSGMPAEGSMTRIDVLTRVEPDYPLEALLDKEEGTASVAILVDERGRPSKVAILHSSGDSKMDQAAVRAVRQWTFSPASVNGAAVKQWGRVEVDFSLSSFERGLQAVAGAKRAGRTGVAELDRLLALWRGGWIARLRARAAEYAQAQRLQTPEIKALLAHRGAVRGVLFLGTRLRPPQTRSPEQAGRLRDLAQQSILRWDAFQVTQSRGESRWYLAVGADGSIADVEVDAS